jgi:uncharacterized membrane protein
MTAREVSLALLGALIVIAVTFMWGGLIILRRAPQKARKLAATRALIGGAALGLMFTVIFLVLLAAWR